MVPNMRQQRVYETNLEYTVIVDDFSELVPRDNRSKIKSFDQTCKGLLNMYLRKYPEVRIQITPTGKVMFHGASCLIDYELIKELTSTLKENHPNGITMKLIKLIPGDKEKDESIQGLQLSADFWVEANLKGADWRNKQLEKLTDHMIENKPTQDEKVKGRAKYLRKLAAEQEMQFNLMQGVYCDIQQNLYAILPNGEKSLIEEIDSSKITSMLQKHQKPTQDPEKTTP